MRIPLHRLLPALLCVLTGTSHAAFTVYGDATAFLSTLSASGTDGYDGFVTTDITPSPIFRNAGTFAYQADSFNVPDSAADFFFGAGSSADPWLSTVSDVDSITFSGFAPGVNAIGGNFFASDVAGAFAAGSVRLVAVDSLGDVSTQTLDAATLTGFTGFVTTGQLATLTVVSIEPVGRAQNVWPTVDNLTLGIAPPPVTPVPEPGTWSLIAAGLLALGAVVRRRRR